jgi:hypothetical protein
MPASPLLRRLSWQLTSTLSDQLQGSGDLRSLPLRIRLMYG